MSRVLLSSLSLLHMSLLETAIRCPCVYSQAIRASSCFSGGTYQNSSVTSWDWASTCASQGFIYLSWWDGARWDRSSGVTGWDWAGCEFFCWVGQILILLTEHFAVYTRKRWKREAYVVSQEDVRHREIPDWLWDSEIQRNGFAGVSQSQKLQLKETKLPPCRVRSSQSGMDNSLSVTVV